MKQTNNNNLDSEGGRFSPEIEAVIQNVKINFQDMLRKTKDSILILGKALEKAVEHSSICEEIKIILADEIRKGLISRRLIELYCLDHWKKVTSPKKANTESEKISLSVKEPMVSAMDSSGNTVSTPPSLTQESNGTPILSETRKGTIGESRTLDYNNTDPRLVEFKVSIPFRDLKLHLIGIQNSSRNGEPVTIYVKVDLKSGKMKSYSLGKNTEGVHI